MISDNFYIRNINDKKLRNLGFHYYPLDDVYVIRFPLDKHNKYTTIEAKLTIHSDTRKVNVDVYTENGEFYPQYYNPTNSGFNEYLDKLHNNIYKKLKSYKIYEKKMRGNKRKYENIKSKKINSNSNYSNKRK